MDLNSFIQDLARGAGAIIKDKHRRAKAWRSKSSPGDIVTEVDEACEEYILSRILRDCPEDCILSEETGSLGNPSGVRTWIIDPLDGTRNYMMDIPFFCCSIGTTLNGVPECGAVYDPIHDEMFFACRGAGATLNGEKISVSDVDTVEDAVISLAWVKDKVDRGRFVEYIDELSRETSYFRRFGSAALVMAYVACGRVHAYLQGGLCPWDVAAATVIIEEAGGVVTDLAGLPVDLDNPDIEIVTGNRFIHHALMEKIVR